MWCQPYATVMINQPLLPISRHDAVLLGRAVWGLSVAFAVVEDTKKTALELALSTTALWFRSAA